MRVVLRLLYTKCNQRTHVLLFDNYFRRSHYIEKTRSDIETLLSIFLRLYSELCATLSIVTDYG